VQTEINWSLQIFEVVLEVQLANSISAVGKKGGKNQFNSCARLEKKFLISVLSTTRNE